ncbi:MAG: PEP-CTERM system histidine kinase PrsK [Proteobacteria bacterium]|nr:PEP-CTERM system histidine kinase PrsK [Pseudomonadota bacterium]
MLIYLTILPVLGGLLALGLGLFTLSRNPGHRTNRTFAIGMGSLVVAETGSAIALLSSSLAVMEFGVRLQSIGFALAPPLWLLFSLVFARAEQKAILKKSIWSVVLTSIAALFFIAMTFAGRVVTVMSETIGADGGTFVEVGDVGKFYFIYMIVGLVLVLIHLENTLRSSTGARRWQIKYVILGIGSILAYKIFQSSQALLFQTYSFDSLPLTSAIILIATSVMGVFIVRHRLMDVDIFISRYVVYNSLTVLIVGIYLIATGLVIQGIRYFELPYDNFLVSIFIFAAILLLFILIFMRDLQRRLRLFVSMHFYKHKHEFRDRWMETTERVSAKSSVDEISATLIDMLTETLGARSIHLWLIDQTSNTYLSEESELPDEFLQLDSTHPVVLHLKATAAPFYLNSDFGEPAIENCEAVTTLASATTAVLCAPVMTGESIIGFLLLSADVAGGQYAPDDFEILGAMSTQAAVQIMNIRLYGHLMQIKEVEVFSKMSSFIMHDLKNLTNSLSLISQNAKHNIENPEFQKDAIKSIDGIVKRMKGLIEKLSDIPKGLEINRKLVDIKYVSDKAIAKIPGDKAKEVIITNNIEALEPLNIDPEAMEMVLINLISNAYEAIEHSGTIILTATADTQKVSISVKDDGPGMTREFVKNELFKPFSTTKKRGFGIGLFQCKAVVEAHNGKIDVISREGVGTTFKLTLPRKLL